MIFENRKEYDELIDEVSRSLKNRTKKKKPKSQMTDTSQDDSMGGPIPLDDVLPPAAGHTTGGRTPHTTKAQPYYGGLFIESLEDRLIKLLEEIEADGDQTVSAQKDIRQGQVGQVGVLGHSKGTREPPTAAAAQRQEVDPYAIRGKAVRDAKDKKKMTSEDDPEKQIEDTMDDMESSGEVISTPSI